MFIIVIVICYLAIAVVVVVFVVVVAAVVVITAPPPLSPLSPSALTLVSAQAVGYPPIPSPVPYAASGVAG